MFEIIGAILNLLKIVAAVVLWGVVIWHIAKDDGQGGDK